jgi:DnaJ-class molecular chaperone
MKRRCYQCEGRGWVVNWDVPQDERAGTGRDTCSVCGGSGKITNDVLVANILEMLIASEVGQHSKS